MPGVGGARGKRDERRKREKERERERKGCVREKCEKEREIRSKPITDHR